MRNNLIKFIKNNSEKCTPFRALEIMNLYYLGYEPKIGDIDHFLDLYLRNKKYSKNKSVNIENALRLMEPYYLNKLMRENNDG